MRGIVSKAGPTPSDEVEVGDVGLPHLRRSGGLGVELFGGLGRDKGWAGDLVWGLHQQ